MEACAVWDAMAAFPEDEFKFVDESNPRAVKRAFCTIALYKERSKYPPLFFKEQSPQQGAVVDIDI